MLNVKLTKVDIALWAVLGPIAAYVAWHTADVFVTSKRVVNRTELGQVISTRFVDSSAVNRMVISVKERAFEVYGHLDVNVGERVFLETRGDGSSAICMADAERGCVIVSNDTSSER